VVRDIMNPRAPVVSCEANLMQVAHLLCEKNRRRVAVEKDGRIIGVVREQELFHELSRQMLDGGRVS
jgi:predicted transcriptional regulator